MPFYRPGAAATAIAIGFSLACSAAAAQAPPTSGRPVLPATFPRLFPRPTGQNGLEAIVAAGDLIRANAALDAAFAPDATLAKKRAVLEDPDCRKALALVAVGLNQTIAPPGDDEASNDALIGLGVLIRLQRLLEVEQYVYLADGRTAAAVDTFAQSLRVTDGLRSSSQSLNGLTAAFDERPVDVLAAHRAQWSLTDCSRILALVQDRLTADSEFADVALQVDRRRRLALIDQMASRPLDPEAISAFNPNKEPSMADFVDSFTVVNADPALRAAAYPALRRAVSAYLDSGSTPSTTDGGPSDPRIQRFIDAYIRTTIPDAARARSQRSRGETVLRWLALHAAIRRYRWQYGRLPATLADLHLPTTVLDPGGALVFHYIPDGDGYTVTAEHPSGSDGSPALSVSLPETIWQ